MRAPVANMLASCNAREIDSVRRFTLHLERPTVRWIALAANRLSNGSLYIIIGALFWFLYDIPVAVMAAATAMALSHVLYPYIKRRHCRRRPFRYDPSIPSLLPPLDEYSFPSGHMMSCVAVMTPLCVAVPAMLPSMLLLLLLVGWARMVAGHHYPTDLLGGGMLGLMAALPVVSLQMSYG